MADGEILRGNRWTALPLHGKNGTLLYATAVSMSCNITISWENGNDVDICAFYTHNASLSMGYGHSSSSEGDSINLGDGFTATWGGDNTSGGPENITLAYQGSSGIGGKSFEIHANWYSVGKDQASGGNVTVTATDARGTTKAFTLMPATSKGRAATASDPGARVNFNPDGTIKSITLA